MLGDDDDVEVYKSICKESRETIDHQLSALNDIDTKSNRILRLNALIIGAILTVISISARSDQFVIASFLNSYTAAGTAFLLGSTAFAGLTYTSSDTESGIEHSQIREILADGKNNRIHYIELAKGYADWIEFNNSTNIINSFYVTTTIIFSVYGITVLSLGIADGITAESLPWWVTYGTYGFLAIIGYLSGVTGQFRSVISSVDISDALFLTILPVLIVIRREAERFAVTLIKARQNMRSLRIALNLLLAQFYFGLALILETYQSLIPSTDGNDQNGNDQNGNDQNGNDQNGNDQYE